VTAWVQALLGREFDDRDRRRMFVLAAAVVMAAALLLLAATPDHARVHVTARRPVASALSSTPSDARTRPSVQQPTTPPSVTRAARAFLAAYLPYLYGHPHPGLVPAATAALRRELTHQALVVPPAQSRLRPRVVSLTTTRTPTGDWTARALITDGGVANYLIVLTVVGGHQGWLVGGVSG
jgi:hypothetical protein